MFVLLFILILFVIGFIFLIKEKRIEIANVVTNDFTQPVQSGLKEIPVSWKEYRNNEIGISFKYPPDSNVILENISDDHLHFIGRMGNNNYVFRFSDLNIYKEIAKTTQYKVIENQENAGILFWRSVAFDPKKCLECLPYSDEFQYYASFDLKQVGRVITFSGTKIFNDGKEAHSLEEVMNLLGHKDFFDIIRTVRTY
jgi:hypothetical protein